VQTKFAGDDNLDLNQEFLRILACRRSHADAGEGWQAKGFAGSAGDFVRKEIRLLILTDGQKTWKDLTFC
jgi:hypothetical protein